MESMGAAGGIAGVIEVLKYILIVLGGGLVAGLVVGFVYAGIRYPDPNKPQLFNAWQKIVVLVVALAAVGLIVYAFVKKPGTPDPNEMMVNGGMMDDAGMAGGEGGIDILQGDPGAADDADAGADSEAGAASEEDADSEADGGGEESDTPTGGSAEGNVTAGSSANAGGGAVMFRQGGSVAIIG